MSRVFSTLLLVSAVGSFPAWSDAPRLRTGTEVAKFIETSNQGFKGEKSRIELIIEDSNKNKVSREMTSMGMELGSDRSRSLIEFVKPADVKGTKLLTWSFRGEDDRQWLYLKSMRRSKRITSSSRHSSFMGSEFTYDDFSTKYTDKNTYEMIKQDTRHWWIKKTPKTDETELVQVMKFSKKLRQAVEVQYFKANKTLQKKGSFSNFSKFKVGPKVFYRAGQIVMKNMITGKSSTMIVTQRKLGLKLREKDFKKESLR